MFSYFVSLSWQRKLPLSTNVLYSISTDVFHYFKANLEGICSYIICILHATAQKHGGGPSVKPTPSFHLLCALCCHQRRICILWAHFGTWKECQCLQNGEKLLCQGKLPLEDKSWCSVHRWSTCDAWQHIWFGCFFEEKHSTCHNDSLPSTPAHNVMSNSASNSERCFVHGHGKINFIGAKHLNLSFQHVLSRDERKTWTSLLYVPKAKL